MKVLFNPLWIQIATAAAGMAIVVLGVWQAYLTHTEQQETLNSQLQRHDALLKQLWDSSQTFNQGSFRVIISVLGEGNVPDILSEGWDFKVAISGETFQTTFRPLKISLSKSSQTIGYGDANTFELSRQIYALDTFSSDIPQELQTLNGWNGVKIDISAAGPSGSLAGGGPSSWSNSVYENYETPESSLDPKDVPYKPTETQGSDLPVYPGISASSESELRNAIKQHYRAAKIASPSNFSSTDLTRITGQLLPSHTEIYPLQIRIDVEIAGVRIGSSPAAIVSGAFMADLKVASFSELSSKSIKIAPDRFPTWEPRS